MSPTDFHGPAGPDGTAPPGLPLFRDVTVMPTQDLLHGLNKRPTQRSRSIFRGGPIWPRFALQIRARHCRGWLPLPCDRRPEAVDWPAREAEAGIWCGPVSPHFGHMIADFGMRIAAANRCAPALPLVFSVGPAEASEPRPFFRQILTHLGVPETRVLLVREPTRFRTLYVPPQAERLGGPGPDHRHLDLMDAIVAAHGQVTQDIDCLFVSRARYPDGRMAAEAYLADVLIRAGATVVYPELLPVADQIAYYRRARHIVFSEGSAVHALQLLGRLQSGVSILVRRPGRRLARASLRPRVAALDYWDSAKGLIHGLSARGRPQWDRALALFGEDDLRARFRGVGLDLGAHWNEATYRDWLRADVARWIAYNRHWNPHPDALRAIRRSLDSVGLAIDVDAAWRTELF